MRLDKIPVVDIHCHILPGIDADGPVDLEEGLEMARIAVNDGIRQTVATPHVYGVKVSPQQIREHVALFNEALQKTGIPLQVLPGAETSALLDPKTLQEYTVNGTNYVLFEFPHSHLPQNAGELIFRTLLAGLKPIIVHPERNPTILRNPEVLFDLVKGGALVQITADSLSGYFGEESKECSVFLLKSRVVHFLATDAHSPRHRRPVFSEGLAEAVKILGRVAALRLVSSNPSAVIAGKPRHV